MKQRVVPRITNFCVVKLSNSPAKAGPMSAASALGVTCVPRLELGHFHSQPESPEINQRIPGLFFNVTQVFWGFYLIFSSVLENRQVFMKVTGKDRLVFKTDGRLYLLVLGYLLAAYRQSEQSIPGS
jgi:hypothetical protein